MLDLDESKDFSDQGLEASLQDISDRVKGFFSPVASDASDTSPLANGSNGASAPANDSSGASAPSKTGEANLNA